MVISYCRKKSLQRRIHSQFRECLYKEEQIRYQLEANRKEQVSHSPPVLYCLFGCFWHRITMSKLTKSNCEVLSLNFVCKNRFGAERPSCNNYQSYFGRQLNDMHFSDFFPHFFLLMLLLFPVPWTRCSSLR